MESRVVQAEAVNPSESQPKKKRGCCLIISGIGVGFIALLVILFIVGYKIDKQRVARLEGMMQAIAKGDAEAAHQFFAKNHRKKFSTEDVQAFIEENNLEGHTDCNWEMGMEDAQGNRIYDGTITLRDGSKVTLYAPVIYEDDQWSVVALLTEQPELPKVEDSGDGRIEWGVSFTTATLTNVRTCAENSASAPSQSEFPDDIKEIYCVAEIDWAPSDTKLEVKWSYLGPDGKMPEREVVSKRLVTTQSSMQLYSNLYRESPLFPRGHYRVKWFVEGKEQGRADFIVREPTIEELNKRGEAGDADALFRLGAAYIGGLEVPADPQKGVQYLKQAAEAGMPRAQYQYGVLLLKGEILPQDEAEAARWIRKAAEQGESQAQYDLGVFYREGTGLTQDLIESIVWTRKAAEQGHPLAQCNLGLHYAEGLGVKQDLSEAAKWFKLATEQEDAQAMFLLGQLYENGEGVEKNSNEAVRLYRKSADNGYEPAKAALKKAGD